MRQQQQVTEKMRFDNLSNNKYTDKPLKNMALFHKSYEYISNFGIPALNSSNSNFPILSISAFNTRLSSFARFSSCKGTEIGDP